MADIPSQWDIRRSGVNDLLAQARHQHMILTRHSPSLTEEGYSTLFRDLTKNGSSAKIVLKREIISQDRIVMQQRYDQARLLRKSPEEPNCTCGRCRARKVRSCSMALCAPDAQHTAYFRYSGDIRFGPSYFSLSIDGYSFGQRIFGDAHLWSSSSTLLAVQEWLTLDYSEGPITALVIVDLSQRREVSVARAVKAFLVPTAFEGTRIVYRKDPGGEAGAERFEVDTTKLEGWNELA
jgi:hypothetical protein